jgi:hypothetical protein
MHLDTLAWIAGLIATVAGLYVLEEFLHRRFPPK